MRASISVGGIVIDVLLYMAQQSKQKWWNSELYLV